MAMARRHRQALTVAILLVVVAAVDLTVILLWQPTSRSVLHDVLVVLWPLPALKPASCWAPTNCSCTSGW